MKTKNSKYALILALLILTSTDALTQQNVPVCGFLPFSNKSGFDNKNWDIRMDIPGIFADSLKRTGKYQIKKLSEIDEYLELKKIRSYQYEKEEILNRLANDLKLYYLIAGKIDQFNLSRVNIGSFLVGGYESYKVEIKVSFFVYHRQQDTKTDYFIISSDVQQKDIGINLVGRPSPHYVSFAALDTLEFDSPAFNQTIMGEAIKELTADFAAKFFELVPVAGTVESEMPPPSLEPGTFKEATIVFVRENEIYINAGKGDNVHEGDVLNVYTQGEPIMDPASEQVLGYADKYIGKIKVIMVKDIHLSIARIIDPIEPIKVKDKVRIRKN